MQVGAPVPLVERPFAAVGVPPGWVDDLLLVEPAAEVDAVGLEGGLVEGGGSLARHALCDGGVEGEKRNGRCWVPHGEVIGFQTKMGKCWYWLSYRLDEM